MSQNNHFSSVNDTSADALNNSNNDGQTVDNNGWANFETFDQNSEVKN
jgi:hypothetical protein